MWLQSRATVQKVLVLVFSLERMGTKSRTNCFYALFFLLVGFQDSVQGRLLLINKPDPNDPAASARWLVSQNSWGVLKYVFSPPHYLSLFQLDFFFIYHLPYCLCWLDFLIFWYGLAFGKFRLWISFVFLVPVPFQVIWEEHHLGMFCHFFCYRVLS